MVVPDVLEFALETIKDPHQKGYYLASAYLMVEPDLLSKIFSNPTEFFNSDPLELLNSSTNNYMKLHRTKVE